MVDLLHSKALEQVCVLEERAIEREPFNIKDVWFYLPLLLNIIYSTITYVCDQ
jgi:hypothetical protein